MEKDLESLRREVRRSIWRSRTVKMLAQEGLHWRMVRATCRSSDGRLEAEEKLKRKASVEQREAASSGSLQGGERLALSLASKRQLEEENTNLRLELESRPQVRDIRRAQRRIHLLEEDQGGCRGSRGRARGG